MKRIYFLALFCWTLAAQESAMVTGKVTDTTGKPLPDIKVLVTDSAQLEHEVRSAPDGSYSLKVPPGRYSVGLEKPSQGVFDAGAFQLTAESPTTVDLRVSAKANDRNLRYMFYGFTAAWLLLVAYVISLTGREKSLQRQIADLRRMVESEQRG